jgi:hypothetical protein
MWNNWKTVRAKDGLVVAGARKRRKTSGVTATTNDEASSVVGEAVGLSVDGWTHLRCGDVVL